MSNDSYWLRHDQEQGWLTAQRTSSDSPEFMWANELPTTDERVTAHGLEEGPITRQDYINLWLDDLPWADILTDDDTLPAERDEFRIILRNEIKRIDSTVTEFLAFARPKETKLQKLNLSEVLQTSLRQTEAEAARQRLTEARELRGFSPRL